MFLSPIKSIIVANSNEDLKEKVKLETKKNNLLNSIYIAKGNFNIEKIELNGNYSGGIIEGIYYYFPHIKEIITTQKI